MSVDEILAAARGEKSDTPAAAPEPATEVESTDAESAEAEATAAPEAPPEPAAEAAAPKAKAELPTDTAGIVAYCRQTDAS
jgi:hypothetical protein